MKYLHHLVGYIDEESPILAEQQYCGRLEEIALVELGACALLGLEDSASGHFITASCAIASQKPDTSHLSSRKHSERRSSA